MRYEFSKQQKREILSRSGGKCECIGVRYGYPEGHRCNADLAYGLEFDHYPLPAYQEGSNTIENGLAACKRCNKYANNKFDTPRAAKEKRLKDKNAGIKKPKKKWDTKSFAGVITRGIDR